MSRTIARAGAAIVLAGGAVVACVPPFSELQSARTLGPGRSEITPSYSVVRSSEEGDEVEQRQLAVHAGIGLSERTDLRLRLERITVEAGDGEESSAVYVLGAGPKFGLVPDRLALYLPVGFAFGDDIDVDETFQAHPTLLGTVPLTAGLDLTGSTKVLVPLSGDGDPLLAFNLGLGIGEGRGPVVFRPEIGMLINPGEDGRFWQFSLGVSYQTGRR